MSSTPKDARRRIIQKNPGLKKAQGQRKLDFEFAAGGVVVDDGNVLLVEVENLEGKRLWTLPKGHVEKGETSEQAALREVQEETGYRCEIKSQLTMVQYFFSRSGRLVKKQVRWYLMRGKDKAGAPDAEEIIDTAWVSIDEARKRLVYPGDLKLMDEIESSFPRRRG